MLCKPLLHRPLVETQSQSLVLDPQDQRQTESIQSLQGQLENVTQLVLNLSVRVSKLQIEVNTKPQAQRTHPHAVRQQEEALVTLFPQTRIRTTCDSYNL